MAAFAAVLAIGAAALGAAEAGLWTLPPPAAAMLGLDGARGSLAQTKPGVQPHLLKPADPTKPAQAVPSAPPAAEQPKPPEPAAQPQAADAPAQPEVVEEPPAPQVAAPEAAEPAKPGATMSAADAAPIPRAAIPTEPPPAQEAAPSAPLQAAAKAVAAPNVAVAPSAAVQAAPPTAAAPSTTAAPAASAAKPAAPSGAAEDEAVEAAESAAASAGADSTKLVAAARAKLRSRDAAGAAEMMLRVVTKNPDDHHAMEVLVRAWIAMGRGKDAVRYAELVVKKRPKRAAYRVLLGDALLTTGDTTGAQAAWHAALELEPDDREAKRRLGGR